MFPYPPWCLRPGGDLGRNGAIPAPSLTPALSIRPPSCPPARSWWRGRDSEKGIYLNSAELYNPSTNTWTATIGSLTTERATHTATLLPNGKVLVAGGLDGPPSPNWLTSAELYDPVKGSGSTGSLTNARDAHTATLLRNGSVLVAGGRRSSGFLASAELYNWPDISGAIYLLLRGE